MNKALIFWAALLGGFFFLTRDQVSVAPNPTRRNPKGGLHEGHELSEFDFDSVAKGQRIEMEHTDEPSVAREIAMDHLVEDPDYYEKLEKCFPKEHIKHNPTSHMLRWGTPRGSRIQSVIFHKDKWTKTKAKKWLEDHDFLTPVVDDTKNYLRYRQADPDDFAEKRTSTDDWQAEHNLPDGIRFVFGFGE